MANWFTNLFKRNKDDEERTYERRIRIDEGAYDDPKDLHYFIAQALMFPDYYGNNLDALADCLGDIDTPTKVVIRRKPRTEDEPDAEPTWFDAFCDVFQDLEEQNDFLDVFFKTLPVEEPAKEE